jgi:hypothetical protein
VADGNGKSLFDGKLGLFDSLDEVVSQWMDTVRAARPNVYIPSALLPRNPISGAVMKPNGFDNRYIQTQGDYDEGNVFKIEVVQPEIKADEFYASYSAFLDMCLMGVISPSTIGVDVKRRDNAEAQREKEKATLYTRNRLIGRLGEVLPKLAETAVRVWGLMDGGSVGEKLNVSVTFGEYSNPCFEAQVETVGKAVGYGIMSLEAAVDELYGGTWSAEMKAEEVERLRVRKNDNDGKGERNGRGRQGSSKGQ